MAQRDYAKILASLKVKRNQVLHTNITKTVKITDFKTVDNRIIVINKGQISLEGPHGPISLKEGDMLFLPELSSLPITYGRGEATVIDNNQLTNYQEQYFSDFEKLEDVPQSNDSFSSISFNAKVYEAIDFFKFVNIPAFKIEHNSRLHDIFQQILAENAQERLGKEELLQSMTLCLVIELIRYIIENHLFIDTLVLKAAALTDLRLTTLFKYIAQNISGDLSNKVLAKEVTLSGEYIGQWFKNITNMNLQRYIETIRLHSALELLKNNPSMKIREVAKLCGFRDLAYFCRKFKTLWGTTARKMRTKFKCS